MSKKIEIINNAIVVTDTVTTLVVAEFPSRDIYFDTQELEKPTPILKLYDTNGVNEGSSGVWQDELSVCVDSGLTPFTAASFRAFARVSLGFNIAPTPPAAQDLQSVLDEGSTAVGVASMAVTTTGGGQTMLDTDGSATATFNVIGSGFLGTGIEFAFDDIASGGAVQKMTFGGHPLTAGTGMTLLLDDTVSGGGLEQIQFGGAIGLGGTGIEITDTADVFGVAYKADYSVKGILNNLWIPSYGAVKAAIPIDSAVTANTAKTTNATHTGDVAGATVLTIGAKKVTAAMMADGVAGELFTFDNLGVISKVPVGTATHVLTSNGIGLAPTFQAGGGGGASPLTTKGDLFGFSTVDARLAVGSAFQKLIPDSNETTGLKWVTEIGTEQANVTSGVTSGAATSGFLASTNNMVEYEIQGSHPSASKIIYYSVVVPQDYKSGGTININSWTTAFATLATWTVTGYIEGVVDTVLSAVSITPTANLAYQLTSNNFADLISAGDVLEIKLNFTGSNGEDVRINKLNFTYNR